MAGIFRGQGSSIARALLLAIPFIVVAIPAARAQLYEQPVLIIDPGMHTAVITDVGVDAAGRIAVTGSWDKTLRVWSLPDGQLLRTIRMPAGPGNIGKIFAVAVQPDGALVAAGGWTQMTTSAPEESIYVFEALTGKMAARIAGVPGTTLSLAFSPDGRYLAAGLSGKNGLRVYDQQGQWREVGSDTDYGDSIYGVTFSADGRLATTSLDGKVRLYDRAFRLAVPPKPMLSVDQLRQFGELRRGWLGVSTQQVTDKIAESLSLKPARGALVAVVDDKGPAKPAGIEPGDVVVKFDGKDVIDPWDLSRIVAETAVGKAVDVVVIRKGNEETKRVTLGQVTGGSHLYRIGGSHPYRIAFSPHGALLAVGYADVPTVGLLDGHSLAPMPGPNLDGLSKPLPVVTWSKDGRTLYAVGYNVDALLAWADAGRGARHTLPALRSDRSVAAGSVLLAALPEGRLIVATAPPFLELLEPDGRPRWAHASPKADFRAEDGRLAVSADGTIVDFGFELGGKSPLRFDLRARKLSSDPPVDYQTIPAKQSGLAVERWRGAFSPTLDGKPIKLYPHERSRSLAIHPDGSRFVLGSDGLLRAFDANGRLIWRRAAPSVVWAVNISGDGRLAIAAYGDGTIRWHRLDDGRELLALYVLADKQNWVAWTPEGFYGATAGAFGLLQWQLNRGFDAAADTVPVNAIPSLRRPDALVLVLQELETARALGIADLKAARRDVQIVTRSTKAPGARLHVLTIGISDYGDKARNLRLNFAARDAQDVASALLNTQGGGLYAEIKPMFLHDGEANKEGIFDALAAMDRNMATSAGRDLAVVMFSGHGTMIDNQFYLVPYGADSSTMARLKADAIPATEFRSEIEKLAQQGRVLVLLDACRSAGLMGGPSNALPAAEVLKAVMNASNVTVLTSSTADKVSYEDERWGHGAFTKALLDALSASDDVDTNHDGVISMSELTAYIEKRLTKLTDGDQQLGLDQRFEGDIFVAGL